MIQRRQTIYLITIVILGVIMCFVPLIQLTTLEDADVQRMYILSFSGIEEDLNGMDWIEPAPLAIKGFWVLPLNCLLIPLLALVDIFLYKRRILQARLNIFVIAACIGFYAILAVYVVFAAKLMHTDWDMCFGTCLPLVCIILSLGATRLILKDEAMVRAADRLRD